MHRPSARAASKAKDILPHPTCYREGRPPWYVGYGRREGRTAVARVHEHSSHCFFPLGTTESPSTAVTVTSGDAVLSVLTEVTGSGETPTS